MMIEKNNQSVLPLCVDLDGTLIMSDALLEGIFSSIKRNPVCLVKIPFWLFLGKSRFKEKISGNSKLDASLLPYNQDFLHYLEEEMQAGRTLILATAADEKIAASVSKHLGVFSEVFASRAGMNLSGTTKRAVLEERFGERGFVYAGNSSDDIEVWRGASEAIVVNASTTVERKARKVASILKVFPRRGVSPVKSLLKAMRLHQWVKNLLIFAPLLLAHKVMDLSLVGSALGAFLSFGLCASSVYLLNDMLDLDSDRRHRSKKNRPFASGSLSLMIGAVSVPALLTLSLSIGYYISTQYLFVLLAYYCLTLGYSLYFKNIPLVDVILLAGLYSIRIVAGAAAVQVPISPWLIVFALFLFFSLAILKRYSELLVVKATDGHKIIGRGYKTQDTNFLSAMGIASGYLSILVLAFYINNPDILTLYQRPEFLWLICPVFLYWISHMWLVAHRGGMDDDPIVYAVKDKRSYIIGLLIVLTVLAGI